MEWIRLRPDLARLILPGTIVVQARRDLDSPDRLERIAQTFMDRQPDLAALIHGWTDGLPGAVAELFLYMALLCYWSFCLWRDHFGDLLPSERIMDLVEERDTYMEGLGAMDVRLIERRLRHSGEVRQIPLLEEILDLHSRGPALSPEEEERLLLLALVILDGLEEAFPEEDPGGEPIKAPSEGLDD